MNKIYALALLAATSSLLATSPTLCASETDDRIESSAKKSYVFKTQLKDDSVKAESKNGAVTLTGTVSENSHRLLAEDTVESLVTKLVTDIHGVESVINNMIITVPVARN
jgi:hyperosmotically inducible protein